MKIKRILSLLLTAGLLTTALAGAAATDRDTGDYSDNTEAMPYYSSVTGTIINIELSDNPDGPYTIINIEDNDGHPAKLIITNDTVFPFGEDFSTGSKVTGYYPAIMPMLAIWPPQYNISVLVTEAPDYASVKVDRFYTGEDGLVAGYLLSQDRMLAFRTDENTEIILANGDDFSGGELEGRRIVVIYNISTHSIPALTIARKLIVLYEDIMPLPGFDANIDVDGWPIIVDGDEITAPDAFSNEDGSVMVPLRAIAEALGYVVTWDSVTRTAILDGSIEVKIGGSISGQSTDALSMAAEVFIPVPVIVNNSTYVPLSFFSNVLGINNAFAFDGQIEING